MKDWFNPNKFGKGKRRGRGRHVHSYEPLYDEHADYNTNAKSYYDYLARKNGFWEYLISFINRLANRNILFKDTTSITFQKKGDWIDNGGCEPDNYDDEIEVSAVVVISKGTENINLSQSFGTFIIPNGSKIKADGLWSPDYKNVLDAIDLKVKDITDSISAIDKRVTTVENKIEAVENRVDLVENRLTTVENNVTNLQTAMNKIVQNLYTSGAITTNNINTFAFKPNRNIATGNINLFGGSVDGNSYIKTSDNKTENDITAGY